MGTSTGTVRFNSKTFKKTAFLNKDFENVAVGESISLVNGSGMSLSSVSSLFANANSSNSKLRNYEIYIDTSVDTDKQKGDRTARVTSDADNTDGYDLLISSEPDKQEVVNLSGTLTLKNLLDSAVDIRVIYVVEEI